MLGLQVQMYYVRRIQENQSNPRSENSLDKILALERCSVLWFWIRKLFSSRFLLHSIMAPQSLLFHLLGFYLGLKASVLAIAASESGSDFIR